MNSLQDEYRRCVEADDSGTVRRRPPLYELTPSVSSASLDSKRSIGTHRRVSMGSLIDHPQAMSVRQESEPAGKSAEDIRKALINGAVHRKSSSMDSTVVAASYANPPMKEERRVSSDDLTLEKSAIPSRCSRIRNPQLKHLEAENRMKDSHSSINLGTPSSEEDAEIRRHSLKPDGSTLTSENNEPETRPRSNSMELLGKLLPNRLNPARNRSRSPSPSRSEANIQKAAVKPMASSSFRYPDELKPVVSPRLTRKLSAPHGSLPTCRSANTSSETLVPDDLVQPAQRARSPSGSRGRIPSPIFGFRKSVSSGTGQKQRKDSESDAKREVHKFNRP